MPHGAVPFPFGKCRICNDKATGMHYGVATCEGCKGFYKRSIPKGDKYRCYFGGTCVISPENRNRCKACRFRKCVQQGMAVEAVKMGRIPKVEKERALEEAATSRTDSEDSDHTSPPVAVAGPASDSNFMTTGGSIHGIKRRASQGVSFDGEGGLPPWDPLQIEAGSDQLFQQPPKQFIRSCGEGEVKVEGRDSFGVETQYPSVAQSQAMSFKQPSGPLGMHTGAAAASFSSSGSQMSVSHSADGGFMGFPHFGQDNTGGHFLEQNLDGMPKGVVQGSNSQSVNYGDDLRNKNLSRFSSQRDNSLTEDDSFIPTQAGGNPCQFQNEAFGTGKSNNTGAGGETVSCLISGDLNTGSEEFSVASSTVAAESGMENREREGDHNQNSHSCLALGSSSQSVQEDDATGSGASGGGSQPNSYSPGLIKVMFHQVMQEENEEQREKLFKKLAKSCSQETLSSSLEILHSVVSSGSSSTSATYSGISPPPDPKSGSDSTAGLSSSAAANSTFTSASGLQSSLPLDSAVSELEFGSTPGSHVAEPLPSYVSCGQELHNPSSSSVALNSSTGSSSFAQGNRCVPSGFHQTSGSHESSCGLTPNLGSAGGGELFPGNGVRSQNLLWRHGLDSQSQEQFQHVMLDSQRRTPQGSMTRFSSLTTCPSQSQSHLGSQHFSAAQAPLYSQSQSCAPHSGSFSVNPSSSHYDHSHSSLLKEDFFPVTHAPASAGSASEFVYSQVSTSSHDLQMYSPTHTAVQPAIHPSSHSSSTLLPGPHSHNYPCSQPAQPQSNHSSDNENSPQLPVFNRGDPFQPSDDHVSMAPPAAEPESCGLDLNYLCQAQVMRDNHEANSMSNSPAPSSESSVPAYYADPQMKEAAQILDSSMYTIFELEKRRALRDKYLKIKREDRCADVPPTVSNYMEIYPMLMQGISGVNKRIIKFCQVAPGFCRLDGTDQKALLKRAYYDIWMLTNSEYFVDGESYLSVTEDVFYVRRHMAKIIGEENTRTLHVFAQQFNALGLCHLEVAVLCCIQLTAPSHDHQIDFKDVKEIQKLSSFYLDLLVAVVTHNHPESCSRVLVDIFRLVPLLSEINRLQRELIASFSIQQPPSVPDAASQDSQDDVEEAA